MTAQRTIPLPDEQPVAVNALRNMRVRVAGEIAMHEQEADRLRAELIHIDAVLRLFDPETDPEGLPAKRQFPRRMAYFAKGEITRRVLDTAPEDFRAICAQSAGAAADAALDSNDTAVRTALEEAGQIAASIYRAEP